MKWIIVFSVLFVGVFTESEIFNIPLNNLPIPNLDDIEVIKERCEAKGGEGTYENVKTAKTEFETCVKDLFNLTQIQLDLEEKAKTGSMEEVFERECNKRPDLETCLTKLTDAIKPCLEETEQDALAKTLEIAGKLGDFACYKHGDRLAMFVAEDGIQCLTDHADGIQSCAESSYTSSNELPAFIIDESKCDDITKMQDCVVLELEKCDKTTPANVADAVFRFIKNSLCETKQRKRSIFKRSAFTDGFSNSNIKERLMEKLKKSCTENGTPNSFDNLETSYNEALTCIRRLQRSFVTYNDAEDLKNKFQNCISSTVKAMKECLPENEQFLPEFYMKFVYSIIDFTIANRQKMQTTAFARELLECSHKIKNDEEYIGTIQDCIKNNFDITDEEMTEEKLCHAINEAETCVSNTIDEVCSRELTVLDFKNKFLEALYKPCVEED